jgi:hypothetical protein
VKHFQQSGFHAGALTGGQKNGSDIHERLLLNLSHFSRGSLGIAVIWWEEMGVLGGLSPSNTPSFLPQLSDSKKVSPVGMGWE